MNKQIDNQLINISAPATCQLLFDDYTLYLDSIHKQLNAYIRVMHTDELKSALLLNHTEINLVTSLYNKIVAYSNNTLKDNITTDEFACLLNAKEYKERLIDNLIADFENRQSAAHVVDLFKLEKANLNEIYTQIVSKLKKYKKEKA